MPLNLASPGILVKEFDLTLGRVTPSSNKVGVVVAPFAKGPVDVPTLVENENDLLINFGEPYATDKHYEHWLVASSYLAYGGSLQVVRANDDELTNGHVGTAETVKIDSLQHYQALGYDEATLSNVLVAAKNPGTWSNGLRVAIIDGKSDQVLSGINTSAVTITSFVGVATASDGEIGITTTVITGISTNAVGNEIVVGNTVKELSGIIGAGTIVTSIGIGTVYLNNPTLNSVSLDNVELSFGSYNTTTVSNALQVGYGITQSVDGRPNPGVGVTATLTGYLKGIITGIGASSIEVKVLSHISGTGEETAVDYQPLGTYTFSQSGSVSIHVSNGSTAPIGTSFYASESDWFELQTVGLTTSSTVNWNELAPRPGTSAFAAARNSRFDEVHVVVIDSLGKVTGNAGTILEKHLSLSKAKDAEFSVGSPSYWRKYIAQNSRYIFALNQPTGIVTTGYSSDFNLVTNEEWNANAESVIFGGCGTLNNELTRGTDYNGKTSITSTDALNAPLSEISDGLDLFESTENYQIDFLLMGSGARSKEEVQALANKLISVAELRKNSIAFISPNRSSLINDTTNQNAVTVRSAADITENLISFYSPIASSTYGIFDSGYKYMYDRFANTFRYVPLNGDIAGICARNDINNFPWYSPAGTSRGTILNAVKLAYNPSKTQRDKLYSNRINSVISSPGSGIILYGDKTAYGKSSAFDRINVRRLFIYLENAISDAAKDVLFEFNDEVTRTNFVNTIEPFLRDVQAKRGIYDYIVICDETNNTPAVIDNQEFIADIYIKPARSVNFIGLNFIATKTGVDFQEVIGNF